MMVFARTDRQRIAQIACCIAVLGSLAILPVSCSQADETSLEPLIRRFFEASDSAQREVVIAGLIESGVPIERIAELLRSGIKFEPVEGTGWTIQTRTCMDGLDRPFHVYVPESYDPSVSSPVLFELHGGSLQEPVTQEEYLAGRSIWQPSADKLGWILVYPTAYSGVNWFSISGQENLLGQLEYLKQHYNIDENRVFFSGYSAGGAGAIWQAAHNPTPWAGFMSYNGYFDIEGYGAYAVFPSNLLNRPIRATNGLVDGIVTIDRVAVYVEQLLSMGVHLAWETYPVGHNVSFFGLERPKTEAFLMAVSRDPFRDEVIWETESANAGRCDWIRIDEIADVGNNALFEERNVSLLEEPLSFGVALAYVPPGEFAVAGLQPGSVAHTLGVQVGDRVMQIDDVDVVTAEDMEAAIAAKLPGDPVQAEVVRGEQSVILQGWLPRGKPAYTHPQLYGSIHAQANGNEIHVQVRHVARFTLLLSSEQFDLGSAITVLVNGERAFSQQVSPDLRFMLEQAGRDLDRKMIYEARIEIIVPRAAGD